MKTRQDAKDILVSVDPTEIVKVYTAIGDGCRCGCRGKYFYASAHREYGSNERGYPVLDDDVSDTDVTRIAKILNKHAADVEITDGYILNLEIPSGRVYTAYLKKDGAQ